MRHELNIEIAARLRRMADLLEQQGETGFRVDAYRRAAILLDEIDRPIEAIFAEGGRAALVALPAIGEGIASAIIEIIASGRWSQLERLEGALDAEGLFQTMPGVGPRLAAQLYEGLGAETLEQLEMAAHDGRLEALSGVGPRRAAAIRLALKDRLGRRLSARAHMAAPVDVILRVDASYREKAAVGRLRMIAPRRFNPEGTSWLPILHEDHPPWRFTAFYSNTEQAHRLGKTHDWVIVYFRTETTPELQNTIVTETRGDLKGRRVVRGREDECRDFYLARETAHVAETTKSKP